jgi:hypothetical protein
MMSILRRVQTYDTFVRIPTDISVSETKYLTTLLSHLGFAPQGPIVFIRENAKDTLEKVIASKSFYDPRETYYKTTLPKGGAEVLRSALQGCSLKSVLVPDAGHGEIVGIIGGIAPQAHVTCVEWEPTMRTPLLNAASNVLTEDFLRLLPTPIYDTVVLDPPTERLQVQTHIYHAYKFVRPGGHLVAFLPYSWMTGGGSPQVKMQRFLAKGFVGFVEHRERVSALDMQLTGMCHSSYITHAVVRLERKCRKQNEKK